MFDGKDSIRLSRRKSQDDLSFHGYLGIKLTFTCPPLTFYRKETLEACPSRKFHFPFISQSTTQTWKLGRRTASGKKIFMLQLFSVGDSFVSRRSYSLNPMNGIVAKHPSLACSRCSFVRSIPTLSRYIGLLSQLIHLLHQYWQPYLQ